MSALKGAHKLWSGWSGAARALAWLCAVALCTAVTPSARAATLAGEGVISPPPPYEEGVEVAVALVDEAEVRGDAVLLGEVAAVQADDPALARWLSSLPVASAPLSGEGRRLRVGMILPTLRRLAPGVAFQFTAESASQTVSVIRASQRLTGERIADFVDQAVTERFPRRAEGGFHVTMSNLPDEIEVPVGEVQLDVQHLARVNRSRPGPASLTVNVLVDGERVRTLWLRGWVETNGTRRAGGAGESSQAYGAVGAPEPQAAGWPGGNQEGEPVIERGDTVELIAFVGELRVSTSGIAQKDGRIGEKIPVRNPDSGKVISGRVTGDGVVEVDV